jgi:hypothetical protein
MRVYRIVLPIATSINDAYWVKPGGKAGFRQRTKAYSAWIRIVTENHLPRSVRKLVGQDEKGEPIYAGIYEGVNWHWSLHLQINCGHGRDISNCYKTTEDVLAKWFGLKDAFNDDGRFTRQRNASIVPPGFMRCTLTIEEEDDAATEVPGGGGGAATAAVRQAGDRGAGEEDGQDRSGDDQGADRHRAGRGVERRDQGTGFARYVRPNTGVRRAAILSKRRRFRAGVHD